MIFYIAKQKASGSIGSYIQNLRLESRDQNLQMVVVNSKGNGTPYFREI